MMKLSERNDFYEKMYFHEVNERERLDDKFRILVVIVGVVFAIISYLFTAVVVEPVDTPALFWLIYCISVISFVACINCYIKAWHSQQYSAFPLLTDIETYIAHVREHYGENYDERTTERWTEQAFEEYMRQSFIDHTSFNMRANDTKRYWLYYGNSFVISAFVFAIMAFIPVSTALVK